MEKTERNLEKEFEKLKQKYPLPEFAKLAEDFDIERIIDKDSRFLLREIRRAIQEKIAAYFSLFETLVNPNTPPIFMFSVLRKISEEDKKEIKEIYKKLSGFQLKVMRLDTIYSENDEAEFVRFAFEEWQEMKRRIKKVMDNFDGNFDEESSTFENGYFG